MMATVAVGSSACASEHVQPAPRTAPTVVTPVKEVVAKEEASLPAPPKLPVCPKIETALPEVAHEEIDVDIPELVDATGEVMAPLYEKIARLLRGRATDHIRIGMYGDSNMTMDWMTGRMRRDLQLKYGDAGHGYVALARPWTWYEHRDVRHGFWTNSWKAFATSTAPAADRLIGFAGIAAQNTHPGATTWVATAEPGAPIGITASRFEVYYLKRKNAGSFKVLIDKKEVATIDTASDQTEAGFASFETTDAAHEIQFVAQGKQPVRLYGVTLERGEPSFVVDSLGVGAISPRQMVDNENQDLNRQMLEHRKYDLILDLVGSNMWDPERLASDYATIIGTHRKAIPGLPFVMMSPADMVEKPTSKTSDARIVRVGAMKKKIAAENKVAFWDFRAAMGGELSMLAFKKHGMARPDLTHFNEKGAAYMGDRIVYAIWKDFMRWLEAHPGAGCESSAVATLAP